MAAKENIKQAFFYKASEWAVWLITIITLQLFFVLMPLSSKAGKSSENEEIYVYLSLPTVGGLEIPAIIREQKLYLPVKDVFDFLKVDNHLSSDLNSINGFFMDVKATYLVNKTKNTVHYNGKVFELQSEELIRSETNLYLRSDFFGKVFGLECTFNFRSLSVLLETKLDLPVIRAMRQELMRRNIKKLKGEVKVDTVIGKHFSFFRLGMADWSIVNTKEAEAGMHTIFNLRLGAMVAGGEATALLYYNTNAPFAESQQFYQWRLVNNSFKPLRQVTVGHIAPQATSSIFFPVAGVQFTNAPTMYRQSFGTYTVSNRTEPDWIVELYVNNVLVDYTKADASGFYSFEVPLLYGSTAVKLRFYGPSGQATSSEQQINIPFNLLPQNTLEYMASAGIVEDTTRSRFSKIRFNYGFSRRMTIGAGMEYLSSVLSGKNMPFFNATLRASSSLLVAAEYSHTVRSKTTVNYRLPSNLQVELTYIKYAKGQTAVTTNFLEERKIAGSMPLKKGKVIMFSRLALSQAVAPVIDYTTLTNIKYSDIPKKKYAIAEWMFSGFIHRYSANLTTYGTFTGAGGNVYSSLALGYRFMQGFYFRPQFQFNYSDGRFLTMKYELEKRLSGNGFLNLSFEKDFLTHNANFLAGFRYDFSFVRAAFSINRSNKRTTLIQSATGSLMYDGKANYLKAANQTVVGRGGITLLSFLDLNNNEKREANEPPIGGLKFRINGGRMLQNNGSAIMRIADLEPHVDYLLELDANSFGNIAWQIKKKALRVAIEPNVFKSIEVPVAILNEASGIVLLKKGLIQKGLSRILVNFYDSASKKVAQTLTESDGYFNYLGLQPGRYTALIDTTQLRNLNLKCTPGNLSFTIAASEEGTVADGFEFILQSLSQNLEEQKRMSEEQQSAGEKTKRSNDEKKGAFTISQAKKGRRDAKQIGVEMIEKPAPSSKQPLLVSNNVKSFTSNRSPNISARNSFSKKLSFATRGLPKYNNQGKRYNIIQKEHPPVSRKLKKLEVTIESRANIERQKLIWGMQRLNKREQRAFINYHQLLLENKRLIHKQRILLREIRNMKQELLNK